MAISLTTNNTHVPVVYTNWSDLMRDANWETNLDAYTFGMANALRNARADYSKWGWHHIKSPDMSGEVDFWDVVNKYWIGKKWKVSELTDEQSKAKHEIYEKLRSMHWRCYYDIYKQKPFYQKIIIFFRNLQYLRRSWQTVDQGK